MRRWTMGLAVAIGLMTTARTAKGAPDEWLTMHVLAINQAGVPDTILEPAEQEATRIFSAIAVRLRWTTARPASDGSAVATGHHLTINIVPDSLMKRVRRGTNADAMGSAPRSRERRPLIAHAFDTRIEDFGRRHKTDVAKILGQVIAHEMGHLLLPHDSHALRGVMRGSLDRAQLEGTANGPLTFTRDQAKSIRNTGRVTMPN